MLHTEGVAEETPEFVDEGEHWTTPVLPCGERLRRHLVPFDCNRSLRAWPRGERPAVVIMGPWKTGTNVLVDYVSTGS